MKFDYFLQQSSNLFSQNKLLKFAIVVFGMGIGINSFFTYKALQNQRVIILPPTVSDRFEISGAHASDDYLRAFSRYMAGLAFNYTPANARKQFEELLGYFSPTGYGAGKQMFYQLADSVETTQASSVFYVEEIYVDRKRSQMIIKGLKKQFIGEAKVDDTAKNYIFDFHFIDGRFFIDRISEKAL